MKLAYWTGIVKEVRNSGMKVQDWCSQNNISTRKYYYWHSKVMKNTYAIAVKSGFLPGAGNSSPAMELPEVPDFSELPVPVEIAKPTAAQRKDPDIKIRWERFTIDIGPEFSESDLLKVLRVMNNV